MQQKKQMEDMQKLRDANQIDTTPGGIGNGYGQQLANMQDRDRLNSNAASKMYLQMMGGDNDRNTQIMRAQNSMDAQINQDRVDQRLQMQANYKKSVNDAHMQQLRDQLRNDQMNRQAMMNAERQGDMNDA